jgi:hypothetical protein
MAGMLWVSDREQGVRLLFAELLPEAEVLLPEELVDRLNVGQRPDALIIDGTQLLELPFHLRDDVLSLPRLLVCTGLALGGLPPSLLTGPGVAFLAKPFRVEDLEAALEWLRGSPFAVLPATLDEDLAGGLIQREKPRGPPTPTR